MGEWGVGQGSAMVPSSYQQRTFCSHSLMLLSFTCVSWGVKLRLEGNVSGPSNPERLPPTISLRTESSVAAEVSGVPKLVPTPLGSEAGKEPLSFPNSRLQPTLYQTVLSPLVLAVFRAISTIYYPVSGLHKPQIHFQPPKALATDAKSLFAGRAGCNGILSLLHPQVLLGIS